MPRPKPLNVSLKREHYPLPVLDDILPQLSNATVFSICDLKDGYLHCPLDEQSSLLTTFATPWGRYKWKRLRFGLKVSSEIFQKRLLQALDGLIGVQCVADDIIIWGSNDAEHDDRLRKFLQRCQPGGGGGVLRFGSDGGVPLKPLNPYLSLRVILAEKGTHY